MTASVGAGLAIIETETNNVIQNKTINQIIQGRSNAVVQATLTSNAASTTVTAVNCSKTCGIWPSPVTTTAAAELALGLMRFTPANGSFNVTHSNSPDSTRTFTFVCLG